MYVYYFKSDVNANWSMTKNDEVDFLFDPQIDTSSFVKVTKYNKSTELVYCILSHVEQV
jgi:hypothetical protein